MVKIGFNEDTDVLEQSLDLEGLGVIAFDTKASSYSGKVGFARQEKDGYGGQARVAPLLMSELPPVHHGHVQVEEDERGPLPRMQMIEGLPAIAGTGHTVAVCFQDEAQ